ncbi:MAG TPA: formylglycine-generating enzyme family protein [Pirellulales bacterium]|nr:formylglycine-generating enzyme family protein [Pirellulales bacterium]
MRRAIGRITAGSWRRGAVRWPAIVALLCVAAFVALAVTLPTALAPDANRFKDGPGLLKAPFDKSAATSKQAEWARYLHQAIEERNPIGMTLVLVPPGEFVMGSPESEKDSEGYHKANEVQHRVRITRPFYLGAYPVRVRDFRKFVDESHYKTESERDGKGGWGMVNGRMQQDPTINWRNPGFEQTDESPVVEVSWNDAIAFCDWLTSKEAKNYRLPTEAEWEYACRAGTTTAYSFGDSCNGTQANCNGFFPFGTDVKGPYLKRTSKVGSYTPNQFGLFDMHGNVCEFCSDWYEHYYHKVSPVDDPPGPPSGLGRITRNGSWFHPAVACRSADRGGGEPTRSGLDTGLRVVREL